MLIQVRWIVLYRSGQLINIDEAGYLSMAVNDYLALDHHGIGGWIAALADQPVQAPLAPALASLVFWLFGTDVDMAFAVPVVAALVTVWGTYALGRSISGNRTGVGAAIICATLPLLVDFSREFHFAAPAAAATVLALLCLTRSDGGRKWGWTIGLGVCVGLMPLSRTMSLAFLPGLAAASLLSWLSTRDALWQRLGRFAVAGLVAAAVASSWLWFTWESVLRYLISYGYGRQALEFGDRVPVATRLLQLLQHVGATNALPHTILFLASILVGVLVLAGVAARRGAKPFLSAMLSSPATPLAVFVVLGIAALASSPNQGSGFDVPLWPPIAVLMALSLMGLSQRERVQRAMLFLILGACLIGFAPLIDARSAAARLRPVFVPHVGWVPFTDGRGNMNRYETAAGLHPDGGVLEAPAIRDWRALNGWVVEKISRPDGTPDAVIFGFRNYVFNINMVTLEALLRTGAPPRTAMVNPQVQASGVGDYAEWLAAAAKSGMCNLLTSPGDNAEFQPLADTKHLEEAAQSLGFVLASETTAPNGRRISLWKRPCQS